MANKETLLNGSNESPIPSDWNGINAPFPRECSVLDFFRAKVLSQPDKLAVKDSQRFMTYRELDLKSTRVANELRKRSLKIEESVVIFLPASCEFVASVIGVLKAGGTYFPIDKDTPVGRVEFLLKDSATRFIFANPENAPMFSRWPVTVLNPSEIIDSPGHDSGQYPCIPADAGRRAYITYTSGSTGQPKGVEIEHHALTNLVSHYHDTLNLTSADRSSMLSYVAFDASVGDIWPVLTAGGTLVVPPVGILLNPDQFIKWLGSEEITLTFIPTGLMEILFARPWPQTLKLRYLITGGDRLRVRPPHGLPFTIINGYGPTENTVFSTWSAVLPKADAGQLPPIGKPLINTRAYVLDEKFHPVAMGVEGELYVGGEQVARGYLGRPDLTAERFLRDPFVPHSNARMYRTGDWARWLPNGELEFLGRKDGQIQIRGRRVELGEVESAIFAQKAIRQVCCVPWMDDGMPAAIVAHIVLDPAVVNLPDELRSHLEANLPDYMIPREFVLHESLPLTPQGKLDRSALINLNKSKPSLQPSKSGSELEDKLYSLWCSLLPVAATSAPNMTFQQLGGDSLMAIKLMLGVEEIIGQPLETSTFLINPTFAGLCAAVLERKNGKEFQPILPLRTTGSRPPLFCIYGVSGDVTYYVDLAQELGDDQPVYGIRSPALEDHSLLPESIEAAATEVIRLIRKIQPQGSPCLVGYSWSGLVCFEIARQLARSDGIQCFIAMVGTHAPLWPMNFTGRLVHFLRYMPGWCWGLVTDGEYLRRRLTRWPEMTSRFGNSLIKAEVPIEELVDSDFSRHLVGLMTTYRPSAREKINITLFRENDSHQKPAHPLRAWQTDHLPDAGWGRWVSEKPHIHWTNGDHWNLIKSPHVSDLAKAIRMAMDQHLNNGLHQGSAFKTSPAKAL